VKVIYSNFRNFLKAESVVKEIGKQNINYRKRKVMKKLLAMLCMMVGSVCTANAKSGTNSAESGKALAKLDKKVALVAEKRASHLSDKMIVDLGLNNYQSRKIREINKEVVAKKLLVEAEFAGNQSAIDQKCKEICDVRDVQLENILSTKQYNEYFGHRKIYNQTEKEFMASLNQSPNNTTASANPVNNTVSLN
jgi:hypothetical protein